MQQEHHYDHIPKPVTPGTVYAGLGGWIFTVIGSDGNSYFIRNMPQAYASSAKQLMREHVASMNARGT